MNAVSIVWPSLELSSLGISLAQEDNSQYNLHPEVWRVNATIAIEVSVSHA